MSTSWSPLQGRHEALVVIRGPIGPRGGRLGAPCQGPFGPHVSNDGLTAGRTRPMHAAQAVGQGTTANELHKGLIDKTDFFEMFGRPIRQPLCPMEVREIQLERWDFSVATLLFLFA